MALTQRYPLLSLCHMNPEDAKGSLSSRLRPSAGYYLGTVPPHPTQLGAALLCEDHAPISQLCQAERDWLLGLCRAPRGRSSSYCREAFDRIPGVPPGTETEPAWHQPLGKKTAECGSFPETGDQGLLIRPVCFPKPASQSENTGRQGEAAVCSTTRAGRAQLTAPESQALRW